MCQMNHTEMPLANLIGHGDVGAYSLSQIKRFCDTCGLKIEKLEAAKKFRMHLVASKEKTMGGARNAIRGNVQQARYNSLFY